MERVRLVSSGPSGGHMRKALTAVAVAMLVAISGRLAGRFVL